VIEDGHVQMRLKRFNISPFGIGGRHSGSITRISRHSRRLLAEDEQEEIAHGL
jgi:hypothetical protein